MAGKGKDWGKVVVGVAIIVGGLMDMIPDEPLTLPIGSLMILNGLRIT